MASWLKVAEDLFEGVDRTTRLVVNKISDEQGDFKSYDSEDQDPQLRLARSSSKVDRKHRRSISLEANNTVPETAVARNSDPTADYIGDVHFLYKDEGTGPSTLTAHSDGVNTSSADIDSRTPLPVVGNVVVEFGTHDTDGNVTVIADNDASSIVMPSEENSFDIGAAHSFSSSPVKEIEVINEDLPPDTGQIVDSSLTTLDQGVQQQEAGNSCESGFSVQDTSSHVEIPFDVKQQDHSINSSLFIAQNEIDEAHGLLKSTVPTGQSKEARLSRICAGLLSRIQEYKSENAQLEELLMAERELSKSSEVCLKQLQQELSNSKKEITKVELNMTEALVAKNSEIESLINSVDALQKQIALSEGNLASLQANMETVARNKEMTDARMIQALQEELASAERREAEERAAHIASKMAAKERETELEHRAVEACNTLASVQRDSDEKTAKAAELEQSLTLLKEEYSSMMKKLQDMENQSQFGQKEISEENQETSHLIQAWKEEVELAHKYQRDAERKLLELEAEMEKINSKNSDIMGKAKEIPSQEHMELEKRYQEMADLLYYKQTQLEALASEKVAAELQLEKEIRHLKEAQVEAERNKLPNHASSYFEEDTEMKLLENFFRQLPLFHRHVNLVGISAQLQNALKLLDSWVARAMRFFWRYPTARVIMLFYLVFVHLFLMYLLHRLQVQADDFSSREVAATMGLADPILP